MRACVGLYFHVINNIILRYYTHFTLYTHVIFIVISIVRVSVRVMIMIMMIIIVIIIVIIIIVDRYEANLKLHQELQSKVKCQERSNYETYTSAYFVDNDCDVPVVSLASKLYG